VEGVEKIEKLIREAETGVRERKEKEPKHE
jgi:hypothetical protein